MQREQWKDKIGEEIDRWAKEQQGYAHRQVVSQFAMRVQQPAADQKEKIQTCRDRPDLDLTKFSQGSVQGVEAADTDTGLQCQTDAKRAEKIE